MQKTNDNDNNLKLQKTRLTHTHTHTHTQQKETNNNNDRKKIISNTPFIILRSKCFRKYSFRFVIIKTYTGFVQVRVLNVTPPLHGRVHGES